MTGFPAENLFVDPENATYNALGLVKGVAQTFFSINTPLAIKRRMDEARTGDLADIMSRWQPWIPPKQDQVRGRGSSSGVPMCSHAWVMALHCQEKETLACTCSRAVSTQGAVSWCPDRLQERVACMLAVLRTAMFLEAGRHMHASMMGWPGRRVSNASQTISL